MSSRDIEERLELLPTGDGAIEKAGFPEVITDAAQYEFVTEGCRALRDECRRIRAEYKEIKADAYALHQKVCAMESRALAEPERGLELGKRLLDDHDDRVEKKRLAALEEARAAQREADRIEREKREALEAKEREAREAAEAAEAAIKKAQDDEEARAAAEWAANERRLEEAVARKEREEAEAEAAEKPAVAVAVVVEEPEVKGVSKSRPWDFEIVDTDAITLDVIQDAMRLVPTDKLKSSWLGQHIRKVVRAKGEQAHDFVGEGALTIARKTKRSFR